MLIAVSGFALGYMTQWSSVKNELATLQNELQYQQQQYNTLQQRYNELSNRFAGLQRDYNDLWKSYSTVRENYANLQVEYREALAEYQGALKPPYTAIHGGNVTWVFKTLDKKVQEWYMPIETYVYYADRPKPTEYHRLTTDGRTFTVRKMELFVQPEFFSGVIDSLTHGKTASGFVREVFNLRMQLTLYRADITDTPQWPAETMTEGTGDCEDFAILMASLLLAGNQQAHYGMKVQMVYMDMDHPTSPQDVDHVLLYVTYRDGSAEFVDSTWVTTPTAGADLAPWSYVWGWYFDL
jgi:hypothetical protein